MVRTEEQKFWILGANPENFLVVKKCSQHIKENLFWNLQKSNLKFTGCTAQCLNGGSCRNSTCNCRPGYAGEQCQEPVCKKPCENGGRCIGPNRSEWLFRAVTSVYCSGLDRIFCWVVPYFLQILNLMKISW